MVNSLLLRGIGAAGIGSPITDADAQAYIAAIETADGQALENGTRLAIQNFIVGCKSDGIWNAIKASCILAGARTLSGALVPLKGAAPTNFNFVSGNYNRKTGLVGDGSTKYLNSNRNNNADPQNSKHLSAYLTSTTFGSNLTFMGTQKLTGGSGFFLSSLASRTFYRVNMNSDSAAIEQSNTAGLFGINRSASNAVNYRTSSVTTTATSPSVTPLAQDIGVFASGTGTIATSPRIAFYSIGESLDLELLNTRVTQLITDLGNAIP